MYRTLFAVSLVTLPGVLYAQTTLFSIIDMFIGVLPSFIVLATAIALVVFIWGVVKMIFGLGDTGADPSKVKEEGKRRMVWGLIALFVLVSVWGLVSIVITLTGAEGVPTEPAPTVFQ